jgi:hypothetical protein
MSYLDALKAELVHAKALKDAARVADIETEIKRAGGKAVVETADATPAAETAAAPRGKAAK